MFTDRDQGEGFVLSASTGSSGTTEHKNIKPNGINTAGDGPMKGHLFCMGEQVGHQVLFRGDKSKKNYNGIALVFLRLLTLVRVKPESETARGVYAGRVAAFSNPKQFLSV